MIETKKISYKKSTHAKREIRFEELENCLSEDCLQINSVKTFDFRSFDKILRDNKRDQFESEKDFQEYKKQILTSTQNGTCDLPRINVHDETNWEIVDGKMRLLAYKVLGINPVVELLTEK